MSFRDKETIQSAALAAIDAALGGIRTEPGEPIVDLVNAFSIEAFNQQVLSEYVRRINSVAGWRTVINNASFKEDMAEAFGVSGERLTLASTLGVPDDLDNDVEAIIYLDLNRFGESLGVARQEATRASGSITLFLSSGAAFTLVAGATVQTQGIVPEIFETTSDIIGVTPSFDSDENSFFVTTSIRARRAGIRGNQLAERINVQNPTIAGVTRVRNDAAITGGVDRQTNSAYLDSIENGLAGFAISTRNGLEQFLLNQTGVVDVFIAGPESALFTRETVGGVDAWIIGENLQTATLQTVIVTAGEDFVLPFQPVRTIDAAVGAFTYTEGSGFSFIEDTGEFAGSAAGQDKITWDTVGTFPVATETVAVTFTFNALIRDLQLQFDDDPEVEVPATSVLVKEAIKNLVDVELTVIPLANVTQTNAETAVTSALQDYFNALQLGQTTEFSEIVTAAQTATFNDEAAVDRIDNTVIKETVGGSFATDNILNDDNEYSRLNSISFVAP